MKRLLIYPVGVLSVSLLVGGGLVAVVGHTATLKPPPPLTPELIAPAKALSDVYEAVAAHVRPAVVSVYSEKLIPYRSMDFGFPFGDEFFQQFFGQQAPHRSLAPKEYKVPQRGMGSGMILDKAGFILTNYHVVKDVDQIKVRLPDKREFKAVIVSTDPKTDVAVIRIKDHVPSDLPSVELGNSEALKVGEMVLAIGAPFGLTQTVTTGIISAMGRSDVGLADYEDFLQTDASINPGNSGGPLVNMMGQVIGMNSAIATNSGQSAGVGFAIPVNMIKSVLPTLIKGGKITRGMLGVGIQDLDQDLAKQFSLSSENGALVSSVTVGSAADRAGIKVGDVIIRFNDNEIRNTRELRNQVGAAAPGSKAKLEVLRGGKDMVLSMIVGEQAGEVASTANASAKTPAQATKLGLTLENLTPDLAQRYGLNEKTGVLVSAVEQGSQASLVGLQEGDLIVEVNHKKVDRVSELQAALAEAEPEGKTLFLVKRKNASLFVVLAMN